MVHFHDWVVAIIGLAAFVVAVTTIWQKAVRPIIRGVNTIHRTYDKVMQFDTRIQTVEDRSIELVSNHGSSLRDVIDRIEQNQEDQKVVLERHMQWGQSEALRIWRTLAALAHDSKMAESD